MFSIALLSIESSFFTLSLLGSYVLFGLCGQTVWQMAHGEIGFCWESDLWNNKLSAECLSDWVSKRQFFHSTKIWVERMGFTTSFPSLHKRSLHFLTWHFSKYGVIVHTRLMQVEHHSHPKKTLLFQRPEKYVWVMHSKWNLFIAHILLMFFFHY